MQGRKRHAVAEKALTKTCPSKQTAAFSELGTATVSCRLRERRPGPWFPFSNKTGSGKILEPKVEDASTLVQQQLAVQQTVSLLDKRSRQEAARKHISATRLQLILLGLEFGLIGPNPGYAKSWMMTVTVFNAQSGIT
jgi:hypothetical protein